ncbi:MAG: hypothetical protein N3F04_03800 [Candidatus Nezhaarchaeota archaeon]|nr:hypothetical protein [Candidatus Nezhaarchaeota archaeon]MDW8050330.1 STT3 domain-containing protein [Nitrososphaerota archaeon]
MSLRRFMIISSALTIIFIIALSLRLLPLKYGILMLNEHDPYYQYYMASYVVERGWRGFIDWFSWGVDHRFWAPWGRPISTTSYPGVAFVGAFLYLLSKPFGMDLSLMAFCCILPPLLGALTCIALFFLGREVEGVGAGLFAGLFLAVNAAHISRTIFGFFDNESVSLLMLVVALTFYVRALKKASLVDGVIAGLALSYMGISWGAYVYPLNLIALFALILVLMKRYSKGLLYSTLPTILISISVVSALPMNGLSYLVSPTTLIPLLAVVTLLVWEVKEHAPQKLKRPLVVGYIVATMTFGITFLITKWEAIGPRYLSAVLPWIRSVDPLVRSVAEHQMTTWSLFFLQLGFLTILAIACLYLLAQRLNDVDVLLVMLGVLTAYVSTNMVRLNLLLAPPLCLLAGIFASRTASSLVEHVKFKRIKTTKKAFRPTSLHIISGLFALLFVITPVATGLSMVEPGSGEPISLAYAKGPILMSQDWLSALIWIRENLPSDAVVASWWDHGYWISIVGNRSTLCDNSTMNGTQIMLVAQAFLSDEARALKIFRELGVTHVVVHGIFYDLGSALGYPVPLWISWGHDYVAISYSAMASIARFNVSDYVVLDNFGVLPHAIPVPKGPKASNATLYKLIYYPIGARLFFLEGLNITPIGDGNYSLSPRLLNIPPPRHFKLLYASEPNQHVLVYEVLYDEV